MKERKEHMKAKVHYKVRDKETVLFEGEKNTNARDMYKDRGRQTDKQTDRENFLQRER